MGPGVAAFAGAVFGVGTVFAAVAGDGIAFGAGVDGGLEISAGGGFGFSFVTKKENFAPELLGSHSIKLYVGK